MEYHAHLLAQQDSIDPLVIDILPVQQKPSLYFHPVHQIVHAVDAFQKCGFAASAWADQRRHRIPPDLQTYVFQRMFSPIMELQTQSLYLSLFHPHSLLPGHALHGKPQQQVPCQNDQEQDAADPKGRAELSSLHLQVQLDGEGSA